ncbi:MAG TPA: M20/M25/M40 family metallo-hydrolase, partial [Thermoanaerobaculia bacterium]
LDVRTTPVLAPAEVVQRIRRAVSGEVRVLSDRLVPRETPAGEAVVEAARRVRPEARLYGSATLSDMVFMAGIPALKCGPGSSERSHTADEFVWESEVIAGARFYSRLVGSFAELQAAELQVAELQAGVPGAATSEGGADAGGEVARPALRVDSANRAGAPDEAAAAGAAAAAIRR